MSEGVEKFKRFDAKLMWPTRILITFAIFFISSQIQPCEPNLYPDIPFAYLIAAMWLHFFKLNVLAVPLTCLMIFVAYTHGLAYR